MTTHSHDGARHPHPAGHAHAPAPGSATPS